MLCEDTRRTKILLERHGIDAKLVSYHEHNEAERTAQVLPRLLAGERVALTSDAGLPGVSDPGARLIAAALESGVQVTVLPGPSAVETALVASGLVGERYQFVGYLPRSEKARSALWDELVRWPFPVVAFESPRRLPASLRVARRRVARAARRRLPRALEALRGGRAGDGRGAGRTVSGAAAWRDHARDRSLRGRAGRRRRRAEPRLPSSSRPERGAGRRPRSSHGSPADPGTSSTAGRCSQV